VDRALTSEPLDDDVARAGQVERRGAVRLEQLDRDRLTLHRAVRVQSSRGDRVARCTGLVAPIHGREPQVPAGVEELEDLDVADDVRTLGLLSLGPTGDPLAVPHLVVAATEIGDGVL